MLTSKQQAQVAGYLNQFEALESNAEIHAKRLNRYLKSTITKGINYDHLKNLEEKLSLARTELRSFAINRVVVVGGMKTVNKHRLQAMETLKEQYASLKERTIKKMKKADADPANETKKEKFEKAYKEQMELKKQIEALSEKIKES